MCQQSQATTITPGFTYAVASAGDYGTTGTHYHSNTGGAFGNPAGKAEVGNFFTENVRGLSEYNLAGLLTGPAFVTFDVFKAGGLFAGANDTPFTGTIDVYAYQGNNLEDISDFQAAPTTFVGSFSTAGLVVGQVISMDISSQFASALTSAWGSLGIRLQVDTGSPAGNVGSSSAWTFDTFRLSSTSESTVPDAGSTVALLGITLSALGLIRRRLVS